MRLTTGRTASGVRPKSQRASALCIATGNPESSILTLNDSHLQTGIVQTVYTFTLSQSGKTIVWSIPNGDQNRPPQYQYDS